MCTTEGVLPVPWLELAHTPFVEASFKMETVEGDIQKKGRGRSVSVFFFSFFFLFYIFLCKLTIITMLIYIAAEVNYGLLVMFDT